MNVFPRDRSEIVFMFPVDLRRDLQRSLAFRRGRGEPLSGSPQRRCPLPCAGLSFVRGRAAERRDPRGARRGRARRAEPPAPRSPARPLAYRRGGRHVAGAAGAGPGRAAGAGAGAGGAGGGLRAGAHPAVQAAALEHDQDAEPPAPQHAGQRRAGHGAVRGAAGHQLQPRPALLPLRHVRAHLHHRLPARAHQALQVRLRARPRRLRARPGPLQPRLARQPGLRRAAGVRPRGLHLPRGHRHRRGRGFLTVLPSPAFPDFPMDSNNGNCRGAGIERCKCKPVKATQKTYLRNNYNYVIRAKVKEVKTKCHDVTAVVEVKEILKSSLVNIPKDTVNLHTNSGCLCPPLSANEEYIIMGYEDEERSRLLLVEGSIAEKWKERLGKKIKRWDQKLRQAGTGRAEPGGGEAAPKAGGARAARS